MHAAHRKMGIAESRRSGAAARRSCLPATFYGSWTLLLPHRLDPISLDSQKGASAILAWVLTYCPEAVFLFYLPGLVVDEPVVAEKLVV